MMNKLKTLLILLLTAITILPFNLKTNKVNFNYNEYDTVYAESIEDRKETLSNSISDLYDDLVRGTVTFLNYQYVVSNGSRVLALTSFGSGFFFDSDSRYYYLMTNAHVVADCVQMNIWTYKGTELKTEVIGYDSQQDVAVCRINRLLVTDNIKVLSLNKNNLNVFNKVNQGDEIFCIGTPIDTSLRFSMSVGIVSGVDRIPLQEKDNIYAQDHAIQVDMTTNGGNSGGPVFNLEGKVIGLVTLKLTTSATKTSDKIYGLNFVLPIEDMYLTALKILNSHPLFYTLVYNKRTALSENPYYISIRDINLKNRIKYGVNSINYGCMVLYDDATLNLNKYSVIVGIDDEIIENVCQLRTSLLRKSVNQKVNLKVYKSVNGKLENNISNIEVSLISMSL